MCEILDPVKYKLFHWATWAKESNHKGYFKHSWEGRLALRGGLPPQYIHFQPDDKLAETVDRQVSQLPAPLKDVIVERFLRCGTNERKAETLGISVATFKNHLRMAYCWIAARLDG